MTTQLMQEASPPLWKIILTNVPYDVGAILAYVLVGIFFYTIWRHRST